MSLLKNKRILIPAISLTAVTAILAAGYFLFFRPATPKSPLNGKTIFLAGDSRSSTDYTFYKEILEKKTWIIDGNYVSSLEKRLKYCDTVFYFCFSTEECLAGARRRIGTVREDLPWSETELDPVFAEYIRTFHEKITPKTEKLLEKTTAQVIRFYDREEENKYIRENLGGE